MFIRALKLKALADSIFEPILLELKGRKENADTAKKTIYKNIFVARGYFHLKGMPARIHFRNFRRVSASLLKAHFRRTIAPRGFLYVLKIKT